MKRINLLLALALLLTTAVVAPAIAQQDAPSGMSSSAMVSGSVVSYTESTLVLRTDAGDQMIFVLDSTTPRPATLAANDRVQVAYNLDPAGSMLASTITIQSAEAPASSPSAGGTAYDSPSGSAQHEQHETGAMGSTPTGAASDASRLPATASPLPIIGLIGLIGVGAGILFRRRKKAAA